MSGRNVMKGSEEDECLTGGWIPDEFQAMKLFEMEMLLYCFELCRFMSDGEISLEKSFRNFQNTEMQLF